MYAIRSYYAVLLQNAISGQNIGMAELGSKKFSTFYAGLPAINLTAANGFRNNFV